MTDDDSTSEGDNLFGTRDEPQSSGDESVSSSEHTSDEEGSEVIGCDESVAHRTQFEVDGDFDRLVQEIRGANDGSSAGVLNQVWDFSVEDQEAEFRDDLREASGVGRRRKGKRVRRSGPTLSQQVKALIGDGNQAFVDGDMPEAIRIMQEVIRIEPRASSAWNVLARCYESLGDHQKALQLRIMGAHLNQDPEEWESLAQKSKNLGFHQQALYCYRKLYTLDPSNTVALWERATLAKEIGELRTTRHALLAILKVIPHDLSVLEELRPVLIELSDLSQCATLYQGAFEHYYTSFPSGSAPPSNIPGGGFGLMEVLVLADLYNTLGEYDNAVQIIRKGCRWLQGRAKQVFWDACEDDREFDVVEGGRGGEGELEPGMYQLDVNARHRLAIARIKMGDIAEGKLHAKIVLSQEVKEYAALFGEIADAYFDRELYADAGLIYEILGGDAETSSLYVLLQAAACRRMVGDLREAAEVYQHVIEAEPAHNEAKLKLAEVLEILNEPRKALDLVLQVIDSRKKRPGPRAGVDASGTSGDPGQISLFEEKPRGKAAAKAGSKFNRLSVVQLRDLEAQKEKEVMLCYHRVKELWARMLANEEEAVREWLVEAEKLIETFRETKNLFLTSRHQGFRGMFPRSTRRQPTEGSEENMASRLQLELGRDSMTRKSRNESGSSLTVNTFRTVPFDDWLRLFMQYAFVLTKRNNFELAHEILRHISYSNAFQTRSSQDSIRYALIACSIAAGRPQATVEQSRKLINTHQFNNGAYRILLASLGGGLHATDAFLASTLSKHLLRELKSGDAALKNPDVLKWNGTTKRYGLSGSGVKVEDDEDEEEPIAPSTSGSNGLGTSEKPKLPTKENPIGVTIYGQICLAAKSYQSALFYLLHAYDYCPHDPLVCLCLAIASIGRAMQRQADNRHHLITQGMAFLTRYRTLRGEDTEGLAEVEYNFGRCFHQLGLFSLAARHYERVLVLSENQLIVEDQNFGLAREAAYNLSLIYVTTGATPLAEDLYRKWLSL